jgi:hypothetical protein
MTLNRALGAGLMRRRAGSPRRPRRDPSMVGSLGLLTKVSALSPDHAADRNAVIHRAAARQ